MHAKLGISVDTVATGLGNRFGNKGAVAISITVAGTTFMFVNSHFAAAEHCLETRNRDYHRINHELIARHSARAIVNQGKIGPMSRRSSLIATEDMHLADYFDYCFWVGDLNYRVVAPRSMADALIQQSDIKTLLQLDQLGIERVKSRIFHGYLEAPIDFLPTYKFDPNKPISLFEKYKCTSATSYSSPPRLVDAIYMHGYDSSSKRRVPSWTDRILYHSRLKSTPECTYVEAKYYCSDMSTKLSDHKPVFGKYRIKLMNH